MTKSDKRAGSEIVSCDVCLKQVPVSEAIAPESADYFAHFCGLDCYEKWKNQRKKPNNQ